MNKDYIILSREPRPNGAVRVRVRIAMGRHITVDVPRSRSDTQGIAETVQAAVDTMPPLPPKSPPDREV